jgi:Ca2+-binding EF-hand superfamily protein
VATIGTPAPAVTNVDLFAVMDVNKDGKIGPTEFKGPKKAFAWVDTDHDGYITRPEATRAYLTIVGRMAIENRVKAFKDMDENKDGKISMAEYRGPTRAFARIDVNHDGVITPEEARNAFRGSVDRFVIAMRFRALDTNHDGKISAAEFKGPKAVFAKHSDKNGLISRAEYAKMIHERVATLVRVATAKPVPTPAKPVAVVTRPDVVKPVKTTATPKPVTPAAHMRGLNRILAMDTNKDGKVGMGEYFKAVEARFVFLDQDKDGYITAKDLEKVAARRNSKATPAPVVATPAKIPVITPATLKPANTVPAKPAVKPGTATKPLAAAEAVHPAMGDVPFDLIDVNHDGVLTRAEIQTYLAKQSHKNPVTVSHHKG